MRIKKIQLKNFKRFTDITISDIPKTSKLVLLIGANGSGKSSLFDAFDWLSKGVNKELPYSSGVDNLTYYRKNSNFESAALIEFEDGRVIQKTGNYVNEGKELVKSFVGRSSNRIVPRITNNANPASVLTDMDSPATYIENDTRFINDLYIFMQQIKDSVLEPVFSGKVADTVQLFKEFIDPLNNSLLNIFGGNKITTIQVYSFQDASPNSAAKLIFKKGESKINYDLLSHGEKQVIILLINFIVRKAYYKNAIIFIDEMDCHLNTALQFNLLEEIINKWIPKDAQLWTATHALGFIDYAKNNENSSIIDFNLLNFDTKKELQPLAKDKFDIYEIAIPKSSISSILKGYKLVVVENKNDVHFNAALGHDGYLFLPANNNREVFLTVKSDKEKLGLRERDYLRPDEIQLLTKKIKNLKILMFYTFENYIYHPKNISELNLLGFNENEYEAEIINQKNEKLIDIVAEIGISRNHYIEFKDCIKNDGILKPITSALQSNVFDTFYPYFNMKKHFNKKYLNKYNYLLCDLSKTNWFKTEILKILN